MALREILTAPDPRLLVACEKVAEVDDEIRTLMDDMLETMYDAPGIGLAAIQVGVHKRVIVVDVAGDGEEPRPIKMANPEILEDNGELSIYHEVAYRCLIFTRKWNARLPAWLAIWMSIPAANITSRTPPCHLHPA
jgi:N-formylmethionyl-tRNA deformylase